MDPELMHVQLTNKVSYCVVLSAGIDTKLLPYELLRVHKSNTWDLVFTLFRKGNVVSTSL